MSLTLHPEFPAPARRGAGCGSEGSDFASPHPPIRGFIKMIRTKARANRYALFIRANLCLGAFDDCGNHHRDHSMDSIVGGDGSLVELVVREGLPGIPGAIIGIG